MDCVLELYFGLGLASRLMCKRQEVIMSDALILFVTLCMLMGSMFFGLVLLFLMFFACDKLYYPNH